MKWCFSSSISSAFAFGGHSGKLAEFSSSFLRYKTGNHLLARLCCIYVDAVHLIKWTKWTDVPGCALGDEWKQIFVNQLLKKLHDVVHQITRPHGTPNSVISSKNSGKVRIPSSHRCIVKLRGCQFCQWTIRRCELFPILFIFSSSTMFLTGTKRTNQ